MENEDDIENVNHDDNIDANHVDDDENKNDDYPNPIERYFQEGSYLRQLRELEKQDEMEREIQKKQEELEEQKQNEFNNKNNNNDQKEYIMLSNMKRIYQYNFFLQNQKYHDDLKHIDYNYIEYTNDGYNTDTNYNANNNANSSHNTMTTTTTTNNHCDSHHYHLLIEQDKRLGKGGFCWDAAFILGEFILSKQKELKEQEQMVMEGTTTATITTNLNSKVCQRKTKWIELGSGTGLCGMMIAQGLQPNVEMVRITDLPLILPLLYRNLKRNFCIPEQNEQQQHHHQESQHDCDDHDTNNKYDDDDDVLKEYLQQQQQQLQENSSSSSGCNIDVSILEWGNEQQLLEHEQLYGTYDYVIGADVVASLYDPLALAHTIDRLCHTHPSSSDTPTSSSSDDVDETGIENIDESRCHTKEESGDGGNSSRSIVYISFKERLSTIHRLFEQEMCLLFHSVQMIPAQSYSRNKNPNVHILIATGKKVKEEMEQK